MINRKRIAEAAKGCVIESMTYEEPEPGEMGHDDGPYWVLELRRPDGSHTELCVRLMAEIVMEKHR